MKSIAVTCFTLIAALTTAATDLHGWQKIIAHEDGEEELSNLPTVTITSRNESNACVKVANQTGENLEYYGYGESYPQLFFKSLETGTWAPAGWHWCGTGMSKYSLNDKNTITLNLNFSPDEDIQMFTIFYSEKDNKHYSSVKLFEHRSANPRVDPTVKTAVESGNH